MKKLSVYMKMLNVYKDKLAADKGFLTINMGISTALFRFPTTDYKNLAADLKKVNVYCIKQFNYITKVKIILIIYIGFTACFKK